MERPNIDRPMSPQSLNRTRNLVSLEIAVDKNQMVTEEIVIEDDDLEEVEIAEDERLHLKKVSSLVDAAYQKSVDRYSRNRPNQFLISSAAVSERSSCASTYHHAASLPESLDGGKGEVKDLISLPTNFESALRINQALQRRFTATLTRLEKTLEENLKRQNVLKEEFEEQSIIALPDKDSNDARYRYVVRPSSFAIPYFKDRFGTPAPMNSDAKFKVDHGYLDLYSTKSRTWLTSEQKTLIKFIQREWKSKKIKECQELIKIAERKVNMPDISNKEKKFVKSSLQECKTSLKKLGIQEAEEFDIPKGAKIDWDKVAAEAFDGYRTAEECQLIWENLLHPSINRSQWTEDEDLTIQQSVMKAKDPPNWDDLSKKLNSGRTPFQVMVRWVSFIKPALQPAKWTPEASKKLEDTVNMLRVGSHIPWALVSQHLGGFTKPQLQSRWKNINPEQSRGPFTADEDFVLIKGLTKFGLNFALIAHFLNGRSRAQVRDRFKRAILPGLTFKPWTCREDKKIMANCSLASQHWRRMALILNKRETCEIRLRFYTLHLWQSISKQKVLPPPLFPISMTKKAKEIKELREKIISLKSVSKVALDKISPTAKMLPTINSLEMQRAAIVKRRKPATLAKLLAEKEDKKPRTYKKFRRCSYYGRTPSWPDMVLTEFFLPKRTMNPVGYKNPGGLQMSENFYRLSKALQLNLTRAASKADYDQLIPLNFTEQDFELINEVVMEHTHSENDLDCEACENESCAEVCPLIPPNHVTLGAFRSLLLHKQKLLEMASKNFLLFQVPPDQLTKLGGKHNTMAETKQTESQITEEQLTSIITPESSKPSADNEDTDSDDYSSQLTKSKRKAAEKSNLINSVLFKKDFKPNLVNSSEGLNDAIEIPTEEEMVDILTASELKLPSMSSESKTIPELIAKEDKMLFQRFLSLFFWPTIHTMHRPPMEIYHLSGDLVQELKYKVMDTEDAIFDPFDETKGHGKVPHLNIAEQEKYIKMLEMSKTVPRKVRDQLIEEEHKRREKILEGGGSLSDLEEVPEGRVLDKRSIIKLKRSLVMKKVWDERRKGLKPIRNPRPKQEESVFVASRSRRKKIGVMEESENEEHEQDEA